MKLQNRIRELLDEIRLRPERPTPFSVLEPIAREVDSLIEVVRYDSARYMRHPIYLAEDWEIMLIAWDSGQRTPIHDHRGVLGSMAVFSGTLVEERFQTPHGTPDLLERADRPTGDLCDIGPTVLHRLEPRAGRALSLHVYRPPLREMGIWEENGMAEIRPSEYDLAPDYFATVATA